MLDATSVDAHSVDAQRPRDGGMDAGAGYVVFQIGITQTGGLLPVPGVRACEVGASPENCAIGDDRGDVTLGLPADSEVTIRYEAEGYRGFDHLLYTGSDRTPRTRYNLYTQMEDADYYAGIGTLSPDTGELSLFFESVPGAAAIAGASVEVIEPAAPTVIYETSSGASTTATMTNTDGFAVVFGLTVTEVTFRASTASATCAPHYGGFEVAGMPGTFRVPVTLGRETRIDMDCR